MTVRRRWGHATVPAIAVGLMPHLLMAASFDCTKATTAQEKAICADPELSRLDDSMSADYRAAMAWLPPAGKPFLREAQREWLRGLRVACPATAVDLTRCLLDKYQHAPAGSHVRKGPYDFLWTADATTAPWMVSPDGPIKDIWNGVIADYVKQRSVAVDERKYVTFSIGMATESFISLRVYFQIHQEGGFVSDTVCEGRSFLLPSGQELSPETLFAPGQKWAESLAAAATMPEIAEHIDDPNILLYTDEGINVAWHNDTARAFNDQILVPWSALRPFLTKNPPIAIPQ